MSPAQQRGLALWAAFLSIVLCLAFLPVSRILSLFILSGMLGVIFVAWLAASRMARNESNLHIDNLPEATWRQPVVLVCGDLPQAWPERSQVLTVPQGCWIRVEESQDLVQVARYVLRQRPHCPPFLLSACHNGRSAKNTQSACLT